MSVVVVLGMEQLPRELWMGRTGPLERLRLRATVAKLEAGGLQPSWGALDLRAYLRGAVRRVGSYGKFAAVVGTTKNVIRDICRGRYLPAFDRLLQWGSRLAAYSEELRGLLLTIKLPEQQTTPRQRVPAEAVSEQPCAEVDAPNREEGRSPRKDMGSGEPLEGPAHRLRPSIPVVARRWSRPGTTCENVGQRLINASINGPERPEMGSCPKREQPRAEDLGDHMKTAPCKGGYSSTAAHFGVGQSSIYAHSAQASVGYSPLCEHVNMGYCNMDIRGLRAGGKAKKNSKKRLHDPKPGLELNPDMVIVEFRAGERVTRVGNCDTEENARKMLDAILSGKERAFEGEPYIDGRHYVPAKSQEQLIEEAVERKLREQYDRQLHDRFGRHIEDRVQHYGATTMMTFISKLLDGVVKQAISNE